MAVAASSSPAARGGWEIALGGLFTEAELAAADQLVQLSGSGGGGDEAGSASSSPRSVNTCAGAAAWGEEEEAEMGLGLETSTELDRRARKRFRLVTELYAATRPVAGARKRKRGDVPEPEMMAMRYGDQCY